MAYHVQTNWLSYCKKESWKDLNYRCYLLLLLYSSRHRSYILSSVGLVLNGERRCYYVILWDRFEYVSNSTMSGEKYEGWKEGVQAEIVLHLLSTPRRASYGTKLTVTSTILFRKAACCCNRFKDTSLWGRINSLVMNTHLGKPLLKASTWCCKWVLAPAHIEEIVTWLILPVVICLSQD